MIQVEEDKFKQMLDQLDTLRWQLAACLSIAEGAPGWDHMTHAECESMAAVRRVRMESVKAHRELMMLRGERAVWQAEMNAANGEGADAVAELTTPATSPLTHDQRRG